MRLTKLFRLALMAAILAASVSCAVAPLPDRSWVYGDLRLLQSAAEGLHPSADILAVYTRVAGSDLQVRIDFLDLPLTPDQDVYIALDTRPGGSNAAFLSPWQPASTNPADLTQTALPWDILLALPAAGSPRAFDLRQAGPSTSILPRLVRDPSLDTLTVSLNSASIPQPFHLQVFVTGPCASPAEPCNHRPLDWTAVLASDAQPPQARAALLMAFWDTFPAYTPALALRRWDGAHTGPNGGRHGLNLLLTAAAQNFVPLVLLDLKTPASLAALDLIGATKRIRGLSDADLLILPDAAYGQPEDVALGYSRRAAAGFGLPGSQLAYSPSGQLQPGYLAQFVPLADATHLSRAGATRLIPLPPAEAVQATDGGPSPDVRQALLEAALSDDASRLVVLGGDLPHSTWGNADASAATFAWIDAHPWIQPLNGEELLTFPVGANRSTPAPASARPAAFPTYDGNGGQVTLSPSVLMDALSRAPKNAITDLAWQAFFSLTATSADAGLQELRAQYLGDVPSLIAASRWADGSPPSAGGCETFKGEGEETCQLTNDHFLAILKGQDARLEYLFYRDERGVHQIIGPSSQFTVGLSDPSRWHPEKGPAADPSVIQGAFAEGADEKMTRYTASGNTFTASNGSFSKSYRLTEAGLEVNYHLTAPLTERLPLAVDPQAFYFSPVQYQGVFAPGSWTWGLVGGLRVEVRTEAALSAADFTASLPFLSQPEDPDQDYPAGHYLPFPISVVSLSSDRDFRVTISIK